MSKKPNIIILQKKINEESINDMYGDKTQLFNEIEKVLTEIEDLKNKEGKYSMLDKPESDFLESAKREDLRLLQQEFYLKYSKNIIQTKFVIKELKVFRNGIRIDKNNKEGMKTIYKKLKSAKIISEIKLNPKENTKKDVELLFENFSDSKKENEINHEYVSINESMYDQNIEDTEKIIMSAIRNGEGDKFGY